MSEPRVVVAVDASPLSLAAAAASAELAAALGAELVGLFVEDLELLRLSASAEAVEADRLSGRSRPFATGDLERQLRAQAARAAAGFERATGGRAPRSSFRVARGRIAREILAAAGETGVVVLGGVGFGGDGRRLGSTAREVVAARGGAILELRLSSAAVARERPAADRGGEEASAAVAAGDLVRRVRELLDRLTAPVLVVR